MQSQIDSAICLSFDFLESDQLILVLLVSKYDQSDSPLKIQLGATRAVFTMDIAKRWG